MKYLVSLLLVSLFCVSVCAQQEVELSILEQEARKVTAIQHVDVGDTSIQNPDVPEAYRLVLVGTDRPQVLNIRGEITTPLVDSEVQLYYQLMDRSNGERADVPNIKVLVPGKYQEKASGNTCPPVIPSIREWVDEKGQFELGHRGSIIIHSSEPVALQKAMKLFADDMSFFGERNYQVKNGESQAGEIYVSLACTDKAIGEEGYLLTIDDRITLRANTVQGAFMGTRTILQLADIYGNKIPKGQIRDYPKYNRRGFMLDTGRKFFKMAFLEDYVRIMSYYKMNEFQIHLNDNGFKQYFDNDWNKTYAAFRLESDTYPGLTAKDGSYTKQEFTNLQILGMMYGVNVIPEIDVPAHALAFTQYRPSLASEKYGMDHLDITSAETYAFVDKLFEEYLGGDNPVFVGTDVHIGTDEFDKKEAESFRQFTDHYLKRIQSYGKRVRLWGALTHAKGNSPVTSDNVIMNAWYNGYADPKDMIEQGYELISTSDRHLYIVPAAGYYYDYLNLDFLLNEWEPNMVGGDVFPFGHPSISGGMFAVWNDHCGNGISEKDVHHRAFPALQVLAQKMWMGSDTTLNLEEFKNRASAIVEAPKVNLMGKVRSKSDVVIDYDFKHSADQDLSGNDYHLNKKSKVQWRKGSGFQFVGNAGVKLPVEEIGYPYEVSFSLTIDEDITSEKILFSSDNAQVVLNSKGDQVALGFKRDGYFYEFEYLLDANKFISLAVKGDHKGTSLLVDGKEVERLQGKVEEYKGVNGKVSKMYIQQTLVFPLQFIGDSKNGFKGIMHELKVNAW